jgi:hypothetical protein
MSEVLMRFTSSHSFELSCLGISTTRSRITPTQLEEQLGCLTTRDKVNNFSKILLEQARTSFQVVADGTTHELKREICHMEDLLTALGKNSSVASRRMLENQIDIISFPLVIVSMVSIIDTITNPESPLSSSIDIVALRNFEEVRTLKQLSDSILSKEEPDGKEKITRHISALILEATSKLNQE